MKSIQNRLRRLRGQLTTVEEAIANGASCDEVIPQLLAVRGAVNSALRSYLELSLDSCAKHDREKITNLISLLVKHV